MADSARREERYKCELVAHFLPRDIYLHVHFFNGELGRNRIYGIERNSKVRTTLGKVVDAD